MKRRQIIITAIFLLTIPAAVLITKSMKKGAATTATASVPEAPLRKVSVTRVVLEDHVVSQPINGKVQARDRYGIYADVPGRMVATAKEFREGVYFRKGDVLIRLDNTPELEALKAKKTGLYNKVAGMIPDLKMTFPGESGKWEEYLRSLDPGKPVPALPAFATEQERLFVSARDILNQYYSIRSDEERMEKYIERAPFSGQLTQAVVLPGSYVQPGQKLGELTGIGQYEMETSVPISEMASLSPGASVALEDPSSGKAYNGRVTRVIRAIDERTQNGRVILDIKGDGLYHGQFLSGEIASDLLKNCARVKRSLLLDEDQVFIVADGKLVRQPVRPLAYEAGWVYVEGLNEGMVLLDESSPSFQSGMPVQFDQL